jgi:hypothetical protein
MSLNKELNFSAVAGTSATVVGFVRPNSDDLRKSLALCLLCGIALSGYIAAVILERNELAKIN